MVGDLVREYLETRSPSLLKMYNLPDIILEKRNFLKDINIENLDYLISTSSNVHSDLMVLENAVKNNPKNFGRVDRILMDQEIVLSTIYHSIERIFERLHNSLSISYESRRQDFRNLGIRDIDGDKYTYFRSMTNQNFNASLLYDFLVFYENSFREYNEILYKYWNGLTEIVFRLERLNLISTNILNGRGTISKEMVLFLENTIINVLLNDYNGRETSNEIMNMTSRISSISNQFSIKEVKVNQKSYEVLTIITGVRQYDISNMEIGLQDVNEGFNGCKKASSFFENLKNNWSLISNILINIRDHRCARFMDFAEMTNNMNQIDIRLSQNNFQISDNLRAINTELRNLENIPCSEINPDNSSGGSSENEESSTQSDEDQVDKQSGNTYEDLSQAENKKDSINREIDSYKKALKVYTLERHPQDYARTQNNIGTLYWELSRIENTKDNLHKAIDSYNEALKVYTLERHPRDYSRMQKKMGLAYSKLADIENNSDNYNLALGSLKKAADAYRIRKSMREYLVVTDSRIKVAREFIHNG
ncbi:MAG: hypothetical protein QXU98_13875, partial [Candidatus Parvarchaeota archaeon]